MYKNVQALNIVLLALVLILTAACGSSDPGPSGGPLPKPANKPDPAPDTAPAPAAKAADWNRQIIRQASLTLIVTDVEASLAAVRDLAVGVGGYMAASNTSTVGGVPQASITIQVPVDQFDGVLTRLRQLSKQVVSETSTSQDVSEEYTDLTAQVKNLQAQESRLQAIMERAGSIEETLRVEQSLTEVQGQIEKAQGRLNYLSHHADFSNITVTLQPVPAAATPTPAPKPDWQPAVEIQQAWESSLTLLARVGTRVLVVGVFFWWLVLLALIAVLWLMVRQRRRRAPRPFPPPPGAPPAGI